MSMTVNKVCLDWLTWYSDEVKDMGKMRAWFLDRNCKIPGESERVKVLRRFPGYKKGGVSYGENDSGAVLVSEGEVSSELALFLISEAWSSYAHITRIDIQVTVPKPENYKGMAMLKGFRTIYSNPSIIVDSQGNSTLYLGSRSSEKMFRLYEKYDIDGKPYLRYEVETKGAIARELWPPVIDTEIARGYLKNESGKLLHTKYSKKQFKAIESVLDGFGVKAKVMKENPNTVQWLNDSVTPALIKLLNNHDTYEVTAKIIIGWYELLQSKRGLM